MRVEPSPLEGKQKRARPQGLALFYYLNANYITGHVMNTNDFPVQPDAEVSCSNCKACCCQLEVLLISDTGVPERFIEIDKWGGMTMARLDDGWCSALDRSTMLCTIYEQRPLICREFTLGDYECLDERRISLR